VTWTSSESSRTAATAVKPIRRCSLSIIVRWHTILRYDCLKSQVFRCRQKVASDCADVVSSGRAFRIRGQRLSATVKALLPTVESLTGGTMQQVTRPNSVHSDFGAL